MMRLCVASLMLSGIVCVWGVCGETIVCGSCDMYGVLNAVCCINVNLKFCSGCLNADVAYVLCVCVVW